MKNNIIETMIQAKKVQDDNLLDSLYEQIKEYNSTVVMSIIWTLLDRYASEHKGFNQIEELVRLIQTTIDVHEENGEYGSEEVDENDA